MRDTMSVQIVTIIIPIILPTRHTVRIVFGQICRTLAGVATPYGDESGFEQPTHIRRHALLGFFTSRDYSIYRAISPPGTLYTTRLSYTSHTRTSTLVLAVAHSETEHQKQQIDTTTPDTRHPTDTQDVENTDTVENDLSVRYERACDYIHSRNRKHHRRQRTRGPFSRCLG